MVFRILTVCFFCGLMLPSTQSPAQPRVAVSIRPLHSLAAGVMEGVGTPELVFKSGASPHGTGLRPSQARLLSRAGLVFWGGALLEPHLHKTLTAWGKGSGLALHSPAGMVLLPPRPAGPVEFSPPLSGQGEAAFKTEAGAGGRKAYDPHYWLDPRNARVMVAAMAEYLAARDAAHAGAYRKNAASMTIALKRLERDLTARLAPLAGRPYLVFHDAFRYFERRFGLRPLAAIVPDGYASPGARRISNLRRLIRSRRVKCVFSEPQYSAKILRAVTGGFTIARDVLDPMGSGLKPGKTLYFRMMRDMGESFHRCLTAKSP